MRVPRGVVRLVAWEDLHDGELAGRIARRCKVPRDAVEEAMAESARFIVRPGSVIVSELEGDFEAAYLPESEVLVLTPELLGRGREKDVREAVLEEALHRALWRLGLHDEDRHHRAIEPALRRARRGW